MPDRPGSLPLAELVAEQRTRLSMSLAAVARRMGTAADREGSYSGASRQTIHQIEQGRIPHPDSLRWLAVALELPVQQIAAAAREQRMKRRQALRGAVAFGGALLSERLTYALDQRGRLDAQLVSDMAGITAGYRRAYRNLSVRVLRPQVRGQRAILTELIRRSGSPSLRDSLVATLGETEALLGSMLFLDLGSFDRAAHHLHRALEAARHAGARELEGYILGGMTFYACYGGDQPDALRLIKRARETAGDAASPITVGWLAAVDAEMQARAGSAAAAFRALDDAADALGRVDDPMSYEWIGIGVFNQAKLRSYTGLCNLLLHRPQKAVDELTKALRDLDPASPKHRCTAMADRATGLIQLGELVEGCREASDSLSLAIELRHAANAERVRSLRSHLHPLNGNSELQRLDDQLRIVTRW